MFVLMKSHTSLKNGQVVSKTRSPSQILEKPCVCFKGGPGFSPEIFEGIVAFSGVVKLGSITNVSQSATSLQIV